jgi:aerobic-type carbon monoxide dehydrogenase small subunit (CoxS/CutS family)
MSILDGAEVVTIEGVSGKVTDAVRAAWVALDVPPCGWILVPRVRRREAFVFIARQVP